MKYIIHAVLENGGLISFESRDNATREEWIFYIENRWGKRVCKFEMEVKAE